MCLLLFFNTNVLDIAIIIFFFWQIINYFSVLLPLRVMDAGAYVLADAVEGGVRSRQFISLSFNLNNLPKIHPE